MRHRPSNSVKRLQKNTNSRELKFSNLAHKKRNSSVPNQNKLNSNNQNLIFHSESEFLCDRNVKFIESGDVYNIISIELAEQSMYFERLLRYHKRRGFIQLPEFLNLGFSNVLEFIRKGETIINEENVYNIFITADYLLISDLKQKCAEYLNKIADDPRIAIQIWLHTRSLYWPEVGQMAFEKILENFENVLFTEEFKNLNAEDVWSILRHDDLNCQSELHVLEAICRWIETDKSKRIEYVLDLLTCIRLKMLKNSEIEYIKKHELCKYVSDYVHLLEEWPKLKHDSTELNINNYIYTACKDLFLRPRLPYKV